MLNFLNAYRSFLFGLLIFSYVFSVFQKPLFETLHLLSHVPSFIFSNESFHSLTSHAKELHAHENLTAFYDSNDKNGELPQPQNEQETKKKIEIIDEIFTTFNWEILALKKHLQTNLPFQIIFIKIPSPPPKFA